MPRTVTLPLATTSMPTTERLLVSRDAAAVQLSISVQMLDKLLRAGHIKSYRVRGRVLVPQKAITDYLSSLDGEQRG